MTEPRPDIAITPRPATPDDTRACFDLFWESINDLAARFGNPWEGTADDRWPRLGDLYALLAEIAAEWWVAQDGTGQIVGYARSIEREGLFELTEFFVRPGAQSAGIGRALLERAFPIGRGEVRAIIATTDVRALSRYHRAGTSIQFPILGLGAAPRRDAASSVTVDAELVTDAAGLGEIAGLERSVLGHARGERELAWLLDRREAYRFAAPDGAPAGFGFIGRDGVGPIAATDPRHLPAILGHLEARAHAMGREEVAFEVPAPNVTAIRHLLDRGYRFDPFTSNLMASRAFGQFDRFCGFTPPFML